MILFVVFFILGKISWNNYLMIGSMLFLTVWVVLFLTAIAVLIAANIFVDFIGQSHRRDIAENAES